jgi:hypothetical protein
MKKIKIKFNTWSNKDKLEFLNKLQRYQIDEMLKGNSITVIHKRNGVK